MIVRPIDAKDVDEIEFWTDGLTGHGYTGWLRWLPVLSGALLWPLVVAAGDTLTRRSS